MSEPSTPSAPVVHRHFLQKRKLTWKADVVLLENSVFVEITCPSENSGRDEDYLDWADDILDDLADQKFQMLQVVTNLGPNKTTHYIYKLSGSVDPGQPTDNEN